MTASRINPTYTGSTATADGPGTRPGDRKTLHFFTFNTPIGKKIQIAFEELKLVYGDTFDWSWDWVNLKGRIQKSPWYLDLNADGRIPLLIDASRTHPDGTEWRVAESGAILQHLAEWYDPDTALGFTNVLEKSEMTRWIFWACSALGQAQAQGNHYSIFHSWPEVTERFVDETNRHYARMEKHLSGLSGSGERDYLAGYGRGKYSWADIAAYGWISSHAMYGVILDDEFESKYPHIKRWVERLAARPAVVNGTEGYGPP